MKNILDLEKKFVGKSYFYLTVLEVVEIDNTLKLKCKCKCGNNCACSYYKVINNKTKSCGC